MGNPEVTADDVDRLLVGFVREMPIGEERPPERLDFLRIQIEKVRPATHIRRYTEIGIHFVLYFGHTSVLEFLTDAEDFTIAAQHSEAASLCFASIPHQQRFD